MKRTLLLLTVFSLLLPAGCGRAATPAAETAAPVPTVEATAPVQQESTPVPETPVPPPSFAQDLPDGTEIVITKHPTGEVLPVGGKAFFIAHADNADQLTWILVDPEGVYYSLEDAAAQMPGLELEVLPKDTLGLSNVPAALDGWGVVAWFFGPGGSAETNIAYITVE